MEKILCYENYINKLNELSQDAKKMNLECLRRIISDNKDTEFGRRHGFDKIDSLTDYKKRVPVSEYEYFEEYAKKEFSGIKNSLTSYDIYSFCKSSGSSGNAKIIPVTSRTLEGDIFLIDKLKRDILKENGGKIFKVNMCSSNPDDEVDKTLLLSEILFRRSYEKKYVSEEIYAGGYSLIFNKDLENSHHAKLMAAILCEDIVLIESVFLYDILRVFDYLKYNYKTILDDIENEITDVTKCFCGIEVSKDRMAFLREEFGKGFYNIATRIWPKLKLCIGITGRAYVAEEEAVRDYLGRVPIMSHYYASSEAFMGAPVGIDNYEYMLLPKNAFYEFIPFGEGDEEVTDSVLLDEMIIGDCYEIVLTTFGGLYRYRLNDVVRCKGYRGECPVVEFITRRNQAINIAGEKVTMSQIEKMVEELKDEDIMINEFSFFADVSKRPYKYMGVVAVDCSEDILADKIKLSDVVDKRLRLLNVDYDDLRKIGDLDMPIVLGVNRRKYRDFIKYLYSDYMGENKPIHVLRSALYSRACAWVIECEREKK